jgi:hypothetical protein
LLRINRKLTCNNLFIYLFSLSEDLLFLLICMSWTPASASKVTDGTKTKFGMRCNLNFLIGWMFSAVFFNTTAAAGATRPVIITALSFVFLSFTFSFTNFFNSSFLLSSDDSFLYVLYKVCKFKKKENMLAYNSNTLLDEYINW